MTTVLGGWRRAALRGVCALFVCLFPSLMPGAATPDDVTYHYDALGRLTRVVHTGQNIEYVYEYDAAGNRTRVLVTGAGVPALRLEPAPGSVPPFSAIEGETIDLTVALSVAAATDVTVTLSTTADGIAGALAGPDDYTSLSQTVTIPAGQTQSAPVQIATAPDALPDGDEVFGLRLSDPVGAGLDPAWSSVTATILEGTAAFTVTDINPIEPAVRAFTVVRAGDLSGTDTVAYSVTGGTAVLGTDFDVVASAGDMTVQPASGTLTFAEGVASQQVFIGTYDEGGVEPDETFFLDLSAPSAGARIAGARGTGTLRDNSVLPVINVFNAFVPAEGAAGTTTTVDVTVFFQGGVTEDAGFYIETADGTATAPADYVALPRRWVAVTPAPGATVFESVETITIQGDDITEGRETFQVIVSDPVGLRTVTGGVSPDTPDKGSNGTVTIDNDDAAVIPTVSITDAAPVDEGNTGPAAVLSFGVALSEPTTASVSVTCRAESSTANLPRAEAHDVVGGLPLDIPVTFAPGTTTATCGVPIFADTAYEVDDRVTVTLVGPSGATLAPGADSAVGIIRNDDAKPVFRIDNPVPVDVMEGDGPPNPVLTYTIVRQGETRLSHSVTATTVANTGGTPADPANTWATAAVDYVQRINAPVSFLPHETSKPFTVTVLPDTVVETDEVVRVEIAPGDVHTDVAPDATGYTAAGIIRNDDVVVPTVSIGDAGGPVAEGGVLSFPVTLSQATTVVVTVTCEVTDNGDIISSDIVGGPLPFSLPAITIDPGQTSGACTVPTVDDGLTEPQEEVVVSIAGATNATVSGGLAYGFIAASAAPPPVPAASIGNAAAPVAEGGVLSFPVTLSQATTVVVTVTCEVTDNGDIISSDIVGGPLPFSLPAITIDPGQTSGACTVPTVDDSLEEPQEEVVVSIAGATNATVPGGLAYGFIAASDAPPQPVSFSVSNANGLEGETLTFTVWRDGGTDQTHTVDYTTAAATATPGDYTHRSGTLVFAPNETSRTISVLTANDNVHEGEERFYLYLSNPSGGATLSQSAGTGIIIDDDPSPSPENCPHNLTSLRGDAPGVTHACNCTQTESSNRTQTVFGSGPYARSSHTCRAAVHSGVITEDGGIITLRNVGEQTRFYGGSRNGVTAYDLNQTQTGYAMVSGIPAGTGSVQFITSDPDVQMSNHNLSYAFNSFGFNSSGWVTANTGINSEKGYFEVTIDETFHEWIHFGLIHQDRSSHDLILTDSPNFTFNISRQNVGGQTVDFTNAPDVGHPVVGTVVGFAWDGQARSVAVTYNGQPWKTFTGIRAGTFFPAFAGRSTMRATFNFGALPFRHAIPAGFLSYEEAVGGGSSGGGSPGGGTPTGPTRFITSDPSVQMSNNDLTYTMVGSTSHWIRTNRGVNTEKAYWEVRIDQTESNWIHFGVIHEDGLLHDQMHTGTSSRGLGSLNMLRFGETGALLTRANSPGDPNPGTVIGFAWDGQARTLAVSYNGQFWYTFTGIRAGTFFPTFMGRAPMQATFNFGATGFSHAIPAGFQSYEVAVGAGTSGGGSSGGGSTGDPVQFITSDPDVRMSNHNLSYAFNSFGFNSSGWVTANTGINSEKGYFEVTIDETFHEWIHFGLIHQDRSSHDLILTDSPNFTFNISRLNVSGQTVDFTNAPDAGHPVVGTVVGFAWDGQARSVAVTYNGQPWKTFTGIRAGAFFPAFAGRSTMRATFNFGATAFSHTVPTGFQSYEAAVN